MFSCASLQKQELALSVEFELKDSLLSSLLRHTNITCQGLRASLAGSERFIRSCVAHLPL